LFINSDRDHERDGSGAESLMMQIDAAGTAATTALPPAAPPSRQRIVVLSSSMLTDRMLFYSSFLPALGPSVDTVVWATAAADTTLRTQWAAERVGIERFPKVDPFPQFPHNYLRRLNEMVWDYRLAPPSRLSARLHVQDVALPRLYRALKAPARVIAALRVQRPLEQALGRLLLSYSRSQESLARLSGNPPVTLLATGPHRYEEPAVVSAAKRLGIPTIALITSWDNLSSKRRMLFTYDAYLVWSVQMRRELHEYYPSTRGKPAYIIGAPQFDVFFQEGFIEPRETFLRSQGLDPSRRTILYALGSPNLIREHHGAIQMAESLVRGELGDVQMLVRPHPGFAEGADIESLSRFGSRIAVQRNTGSSIANIARSQDEKQIRNWVNTFRWADVVVNLSSTVTVDAALLDKPVVNLDYDPEPGRPNQALVKDINHVWTHFKPLAESGGVWLVNSPAEALAAVRAYLDHPELHREQRRWIPEYVCGFRDGRSGDRMAAAVLDFIQQHAR
jgi:hypothetical protein